MPQVGCAPRPGRRSRSPQITKTASGPVPHGTGPLGRRRQRPACYVQRYAWFGLEATPADGSMGLFSSAAAATTVGRAFEAAG